MPIILTVHGATALAARLERAGANAEAGARVVVRASAARLETGAKIKAPVDTGALRNSISTSTMRGGLAAEVGPTVNYAAYVEYGTSRMRPEPYMGPATDAVAPQFEAAIASLGTRI